MVDLFISEEKSREIDVGIMNVYTQVREWDLDDYILGMQKALTYGLLNNADGNKVRLVQHTIRVAQQLRLFKVEMET